MFDEDDQGAVLAFQKVNGLERTGEVDAGAVGAALPTPACRGRATAATTSRSTRRARCSSSSATARSSLTTHVSTGATGNTPLGEWHVYSKIAGWSWVLWYPSYFLRGFAIHGYPSVPAYPASHGCVRVPMWLATSLYAQIPMGSSIFIYT